GGQRRAGADGAEAPEPDPVSMFRAQRRRKRGPDEHRNVPEFPPLADESPGQGQRLARPLSPDDLVAGPQDRAQFERVRLNELHPRSASPAATSVASAILYSGPSTIRPSTSMVACPRAIAASYSTT